MSIKDKIKADHKVKSDRLRVMKKKLKNRVPISKLKEMLSHEKRFDVNPSDYAGWSHIDDEGYARACGRKEARMELLESLIRDFEKK